MTNKNMKVKLTIGDWSGDGHNQSEDFVFEVNKSVEEIRQAYKDSCKLTGMQFNHNENYTGIKYDWQAARNYEICTKYEDGCMRADLVKKLKTFGLDATNFSIEDVEEGEDCHFDTDTFAELIMEFIKLSLHDLTYEEAAFKKSELKTIPAINGWWNEQLNVQFGYGLFY
jgi:hypothetical protein